LSAQHGVVTKLLLILLASTAIADSLAPKAEPPLLIDSQPAPASLDADR
jgi:hypothetical protein